MDQAAWTQITAVMDKPGVEIYHVPLTLRAHREGDQWAAFCEELAVHSCGDTIEEALGNAIAATMLYLNTIENLGQRRTVFHKRGIKPELGWPREDEADTQQVRAGEVVTRVYAGTEMVG